MKTKARVLILFVITATLVGCVERRGIESKTPQPMQAMNITLDPVTYASDTVEAVRSDTAEFFVIDMTGKSPTQDGYDDVQLWFGHVWCWETIDVEIYDHADQAWVALAIRIAIPNFCGGFGYGSSRVLSTYGDPAASPFIGEDVRLLLRGSELVAASAAAVRYRPDYQFVTVIQTTIRRGQQMAWDGEHILVASDVWTGDEYPFGDSLFAYAPSGARVQTIWRPVSSIFGMTSDDDGRIWIMSWGPEKTIAVLDEEGQELDSFAFSGQLTGLAWVNGLLWVEDRDHGDIVAIDPEASVSTGEAVVSSRFSFPVYPQTITIKDSTLLAAWNGGIGEFNMQGDVLDFWETDLWIDDIIWDGEMLWVLHGGPFRPGLTSAYLSRFTLP